MAPKTLLPLVGLRDSKHMFAVRPSRITCFFCGTVFVLSVWTTDGSQNTGYSIDTYYGKCKTHPKGKNILCHTDVFVLRMPMKHWSRFCVASLWPSATFTPHPSQLPVGPPSSKVLMFTWTMESFKRRDAVGQLGCLV